MFLNVLGVINPIQIGTVIVFLNHCDTKASNNLSLNTLFSICLFKIIFKKLSRMAEKVVLKAIQHY